MAKTYDVIIAGGGPVGLFLACELALAGTSVLVLERDAQPKSPWKAKPLGLRGLNTSSMEAFYRRGLLDKVFGPKPRPPFQKKPGFQSAGHFAGIMLDANKLDLSRFKYRIEGPSLLPGPSTIEKIETTLTERTEALDVEILRYHGISETVVEEDEGVAVIADDGKTYRGRWLVGCDGARSVVRKAAGIGFAGTEATFTAYAVHCEFDRPEMLQRGFNVTATGMYITGLPGSLYLVDFDNGAFDRRQEITVRHLQDVMDRILGTRDVKITKLHLASAFTDASQQAIHYRKGRILLAGDAAHIHPPFGAPGLNLGLGDAMNLGWKLAATVKKEHIHGDKLGGLALLDTYESERHPIGSQVLEHTRAQVEALKPTAHGRAIRALMQDLIDTMDGANLFIDQFWGLSQRYRIGSGDDTAHALVGCSAPDFEFSDGSRLGPKFETGKGVLVDFNSAGEIKGLIASQEYSTKVDYINMNAVDQCGLQALLVRPDGFVAWAIDVGVEPQLSRVSAALATWFGP